MDTVGKYELQVSSDKCLQVFKSDLGSFPIGKISLKFQRSGETAPQQLNMSTIMIIGEELSFTADSNELGVIITGRLNYHSSFDGLDCNLIIESRVDTPSFNLMVEWIVEDAAVPCWLVPGVMYKDNRPLGSSNRYPGFATGKLDLANYLSPSWSFASERSAMPCVFSWTKNYSLYLGTRPRFDSRETGLLLRGSDGIAMLGFSYPAREEPVRNCSFPPDGNTPLIQWFSLKAGQRCDLWFQFAASSPDIHYYDRIIRYRYMAEKDTSPLNPWMSINEATELLSHGLYQWHYDSQRAIIAETSVFDRYYAKKKDYFDRDSMHVAWISGIPVAYSLLWLGRNTHSDKYTTSALKVIDFIVGHLAPTGTFWGQWNPDRGWIASWAPTDNLLHARTLAEATLFLIRALRLELRRGFAHPNWVKAIFSNLLFCMNVQREDGNFGTYYNAVTGAVESWNGTAGILWIAALAAAAMLFQDTEYIVPALRAANYYAPFIEDECLFGAPEDIGMAPSSEDGYCALLAYQLLYHFNRFERWLDLSRRAAEWFLTFRMSYNVEFPRETLLGQYDFRTRGADIASVVNAHLHHYGLICYPELMRLSYFYKDDYFKERANDNLLCFRQMIARHDGDFGARKGMVSEQFFHTDWTQPKGHVLALSHAWCIGHALFANLCEDHQNTLP